MVIVLTKTYDAFIIVHVHAEYTIRMQNTPNVTWFKFIFISGQNKIKSEPHTFTHYKRWNIPGDRLLWVKKRLK